MASVSSDELDELWNSLSTAAQDAATRFTQLGLQLSIAAIGQLMTLGNRRVHAVNPATGRPGSITGRLRRSSDRAKGETVGNDIVRLEEILETEYGVVSPKLEADVKALAFILLKLLTQPEQHLLGEAHVFDNTSNCCIRCGKSRITLMVDPEVCDATI
jgi:hypothetical protein